MDDHSLKHIFIFLFPLMCRLAPLKAYESTRGVLSKHAHHASHLALLLIWMPHMMHVVNQPIMPS